MAAIIEKIQRVIMSKLSIISGMICLLAIVLAGCATTRSAAAMKIQETDAAGVINCRYVGDVHGSSGWPASTPMQNAKNEGMEMAARFGATHVVWGTIAGGKYPFVSGRAYICK